MTKVLRITTVPVSLKILLKGQLQFMSKHFEIVGVSSPGAELEEVQKREGIRVIAVPMKRQVSLMNDLISLIRLYFVVKKEKPQIIHTHTPKAGMLGMIAGWLARVPVRLHTVAGLPLMEEIGLKRRILNTVEKLTYACATKIYPNSIGLKEFILAQGFCSEQKMKVIANGSSNGIDTIHFAPDKITEETKNVLRATYQLANTDFIFIFIGRLVKDKGINELISAFKKLNKEYPKVKLLLVGEQEAELDPLEPLTVQLIKANQAIITTGFQKDVRPYLSIAHALVFPSYREGFPNVPMQAGSMGLPAIVTDINGCNEIILPGQNGEIIPPSDEAALYAKMTEWVANPEKVTQMAANSRELIVSRFEQKVVWEALLEEYKVLLKYGK